MAEQQMLPDEQNSRNMAINPMINWNIDWSRETFIHQSMKYVFITAIV